MSTKQFALTTIDNPYNPFDEFLEWFAYDEQKGYHTCSLLARLTHTSDALSDYENSLDIEHTIDEILKNDFQGIYMKVETD